MAFDVLTPNQRDNAMNQNNSFLILAPNRMPMVVKGSIEHARKCAMLRISHLGCGMAIIRK